MSMIKDWTKESRAPSIKSNKGPSHGLHCACKAMTLAQNNTHQ